MSKASDNVLRLISMMDKNPYDFKSGDYTITHIPSGVEIWTGNGRGGYGIWKDADGRRCHTDFPFWSQFVFDRALKRWKATQDPDRHFWDKLFSSSDQPHD